MVLSYNWYFCFTFFLMVLWGLVICMLTLIWDGVMGDFWLVEGKLTTICLILSYINIIGVYIYIFITVLGPR